MKYQISANFIQKKDFILGIDTAFSQSDIVLQDARNKIKKVLGDDLDLVVKSFKVPNFLNSILYTFLRRSKARRSFEYSLKIADFVPQGVAYIEYFEKGLLAKSYFISEAFNYDFTIREPLLNQHFINKQEIYKAFALFSYRLHEDGILHKDYSPGNILIKKIADQYVVKVIDINRMAFHSLSLKQRMHNFSKLWASDDDLDMIVEEYAKLSDFDAGQCLKLAKHYNQRNKRFKNVKKRLKGLPVND
ncbi:MAG: serine/threonine protein kinase [Oceanospirillaceae bacterium]|jgi:serine/threonine protein kinase